MSINGCQLQHQRILDRHYYYNESCVNALTFSSQYNALYAHVYTHI